MVVERLEMVKVGISECENIPGGNAHLDMPVYRYVAGKLC